MGVFDVRKPIPDNTEIELFEGYEADCTTAQKFKILSCAGKGGSVITYKVSFEKNGIEQYCFLKELYPYYSAVLNHLKRSPADFSLKVSHSISDSFTNVEEFCLIDSTEGQEFVEDYKRISKLTADDESGNLAVCRASGIYHNDSTYFITVPFESERTLKDYLKDNQESLIAEDIVKIARELTLITSYLHNKGFLHLDIKPANLLFKQIVDRETGKTGLPHISFLDTGTVIPIDDVQKYMGILPSSEGYSSPEQADSGELSTENPRTADIFSIGAVIFRMLTGEFATEEVIESSVFGLESNGKLSNCSASLKKGFDILLRKTLSISPSLRYQSCEELIDDLDKLIKICHSDLSATYYKAMDILSETFDEGSEGSYFRWRKKEEYVLQLFSGVSADKKTYSSLYELLCGGKTENKCFYLAAQGGGGKSGQLKRLCYELQKSFFEADKFGSREVFAPILIDSKTVNEELENGENALKRAVFSALGLTSWGNSIEENAKTLFDGGKFILLLDGLNEINRDRHVEIINEVKALTALPNVSVILSGRSFSEIKGFQHLYINSLSEETVRRYLNANKLNSATSKLLAANLYLLKKFKELLSESGSGKEREVFAVETDVLSDYIENRIKHNQSEFDIDKTDFVKSLAVSAYKAMEKNSLRFDDEALTVCAEKCGIIISDDNGNWAFEHQIMRDFILSYGIFEALKRQEYSNYLSKELNRDVTAYLGHLAEEHKICDNSSVKKDYDRWLEENMPDDKSVRGTLITRSICNIKQWKLSTKEQTWVIANLFVAIKQSRQINLHTFFLQTADEVKKHSSTLQSILYNTTVDKAELKKIDALYGLPLSDYIGKTAQKNQKFRLALLALLALVIIGSIGFLIYRDLPHPVIVTSANAQGLDGVCVAGENTKISFGFNIVNSSDGSYMVHNLSREDFIFEGFDADISFSHQSNGYVASLTNIKLDKEIKPTDVAECKVYIKRNVVSSQRGNDKVLVSKFDIITDERYIINTSVEDMNFNTIQIGSDWAFTLNFTSEEKIISEFSADSLILHNFTADMEITEYHSCEDGCSYSYYINLYNIQPTGSGEKYIEVLRGAVYNDRDVYSYGAKTAAFETVNDFVNLNAPKVSRCDFYYDDIIGPDGSMVMIIDFMMGSDANDDMLFTTNFTKDSLEFIGFTCESVDIRGIGGDAHCYWVLLSGINPTGDGEMALLVEGSVAVSKYGIASDAHRYAFKDFSKIFSGNVPESNRPKISLADGYTVDSDGALNFTLNIDDDSVLPDIDMAKLAESIELVGASHNSAEVSYGGEWITTHRKYSVKIDGISVKNNSSQLKLKIRAGAVSDSYHNDSEELTVDVPRADLQGKISDYNKATFSDKVIAVKPGEIKLNGSNTAKVEIVLSESIDARAFNTDNIILDGLSAQKRIINYSNAKIVLELSDIKLTSEKDKVIIWAKDKNGKLYKNYLYVAE